MYDYVVIIHPTSEELLHKYEPGMKNKPRQLIKKVLEWMSPFKASEIEGLNSNLGRTAKGAMVMCPLLLEQMATMSPSKVLKSVIRTVEFAKSLNPKLIGLTAYAAFSGNKGVDLAKFAGVPLTIGANYTLAMIPETILRSTELMDIDLEESSVLILGATSSVGRYCIEILSHFVQEIYVTSHSDEKLSLMLAEMPKEKRIKLRKARDLNSVIDRVNIVIIATNRIPADFDVNRLKAGSVVFDSSYPRHMSRNAREDVLVVDGLSIKPPGNVRFNFDFGLPEGVCYPCIAEAMILALERKYENFSLGKEFDVGKIRQIIRIGAKHGFEVSSLTSQERVIANEEVLAIKNSRLKKKKRKVLLWV